MAWGLGTIGVKYDLLIFFFLSLSSFTFIHSFPLNSLDTFQRVQTCNRVTRSHSCFKNFKILTPNQIRGHNSLREQQTPASFIISAALKKRREKKGPHDFLQLQSDQRETLRQPLTQSILKVLEACVTLNDVPHLYDSLQNQRIKEIPGGPATFLSDEQGRSIEKTKNEKKKD